MSNRSIGLKVNSTRIQLTDSNGNIFPLFINPDKHYRNLIKLQNNRNILDFSNSKMDLIRKFLNDLKKDISILADNLVKMYDQIYLEDFKVTSIIGYSSILTKLAKYGLEILYSELSEKFKDTTKDYSRYVQLVFIPNLLMKCSNCGLTSSKNLYVTIHQQDPLTEKINLKCRKCENDIDIYYNAAINILNEGKKLSDKR